MCVRPTQAIPASAAHPFLAVFFFASPRCSGTSASINAHTSIPACLASGPLHPYIAVAISISSVLAAYSWLTGASFLTMAVWRWMGYSVSLICCCKHTPSRKCSIVSWLHPAANRLPRCFRSGWKQNADWLYPNSVLDSKCFATGDPAS